MRMSIIMICLSWISLFSFAQEVKGILTDQNTGQAIPGALITLKGQNKTFLSAVDGSFTVPAQGDSILLSIRSIAHLPLFIKQKATGQMLLLKMIPAPQTLKEVVVSTGFQDVPLERAVGSFVQLNKEQLNRRVSTGILERLEDITPGLIFNRGRTAIGTQDISIRGRSSLFSANQPLIVVDDLPFNGDINTLNPNDVESITLLKDAAAASIYGVQAGNGVIVIKTKRGLYQQLLNVGFNNNVTFGEKPDLFYQSVMSSADFIGMEQKLFARGFYNAAENSIAKTALSPVVELLIAQRDGRISSAELNAQLDALKQQDVRNDQSEYLNRNAVNQQYNIFLQGGAKQNSYYYSLGYDRNLASAVGDQSNRISLLANQKWNMLKRKLQLESSLSYSKQMNQNNALGTINWKPGEVLYPYARLADDAGNPLAVTRDYRTTYLQSITNNGLLNWTYKPLEELNASDLKQNINELRWNTQFNYRFTNGISTKLLYSYQQSDGERNELQSVDSYFTRNLINQFTETTATGLVRRVPLGGIIDRDLSQSQSHQLRGVIQYDQTFDKKEWHLLGGYEFRILDRTVAGFRQYGYSEDNSGTVPVDYLTPYPRYQSPAVRTIIPFQQNENAFADRNQSYFLNGAFTYLKKYTLSGSARFDQSNLFGVAANQRGVPLWSIGGGWNISDEGFYKWKQVPFLKLRASYGFNGNINRSVTAFTTARFFNAAPFTLLPYADITNPPNPDLRWERVKIANIGLDFSTENRRLSGSIEYFNKKGLDLIGESPFAPSSGITSFTGNTASTNANGVDVNIQSLNLKRGEFKWQTQWIASWIKEVVSDYQLKATGSNYLLNGDGGIIYPFEGRPLFAVYSLPYGGLDPNTGEIQGLLNGELSKEYNAIISASTADAIQFSGPARPTFFGAVNNTFSYQNFSVSANISFRTGYSFRRPSVVYNSVLSGRGGHGDYALRWQQPGDEAFTTVPSEPSVLNNNRDNLYRYSDILVQKGDHIRLQDIRLSYQIPKLGQLPIRNAQIYAYANNLGLLWKASSGNLDPDYPNFLPVRTLALGATFNF